MVDGERWAVRLVRGVQALCPYAAEPVARRDIVNQLPVGRPMRRGFERAPVGESRPFPWRRGRLIVKRRNIDAGEGARKAGYKSDPAVIGRKQRLAKIGGRILKAEHRPPSSGLF